MDNLSTIWFTMAICLAIFTILGAMFFGTVKNGKEIQDVETETDQLIELAGEKIKGKR